MNVQINQLVKTLLKKESLDQCSLEELEQFAERHPYFGAAQLLLTKKLQSEKPERYDEQLQKTFLFFHNPLWVQHLLNDTGNAEIIEKEKKQNGHLVSENISFPSEPAITTELQNPGLETQADTRVPNGIITGETISIVDNSNSPASIIAESDDSTKQENISRSVTETQDSPVEQEAISQPEEKIIAAEKQSEVKSELIFEPFHTVDYFASQGIKYKEEDKPADKFGQQLRSFTDWLKTMKKLPIAEVEKTITPDSEKKVVQMAAHSLDAKEVVTEAMAAVWEKQGNKEKAIEIYRKLSLLDPSKSVYFAAKIEDLKKKN